MKGQELVLVKCWRGALPARMASESCCSITTSHTNWVYPVWLEPPVQRWASAQLHIHEHPCCTKTDPYLHKPCPHGSVSCREGEGPVLIPCLSTTRRGAPLRLGHSGASRASELLQGSSQDHTGRWGSPSPHSGSTSAIWGFLLRWAQPRTWRSSAGTTLK